MSKDEFVMPSLTLYGIFTVNEPRTFLLEKVNSECSVVLGFVKQESAFEYLNEKISEQSRSRYFIDIITIDIYLATKMRFDERHKDGLFALKVIE